MIENVTQICYYDERSLMVAHRTATNTVSAYSTINRTVGFYDSDANIYHCIRLFLLKGRKEIENNGWDISDRIKRFNKGVRLSTENLTFVPDVHVGAIDITLPWQHYRLAYREKGEAMYKTEDGTTVELPYQRYVGEVSFNADPNQDAAYDRKPKWDSKEPWIWVDQRRSNITGSIISKLDDHQAEIVSGLGWKPCTD